MHTRGGKPELQEKPDRRTAEGARPVSRAEKLLVAWLAATFSLCVFVALPDVLTDLAAPSRRAARTYLRTIGLDQHWKMFVGDDWDIPQLRIMATDFSEGTWDVTSLLLQNGKLYGQLLDDRMTLLHFGLARLEAAVPHAQDRGQIFERYADAVRARLGPGVLEVRFEAVYDTKRVRPASGSKIPTAIVPLAIHRWD